MPPPESSRSESAEDGSPRKGQGGSSELWRFLVDENLPLLLVRQLQAAGYFAEHARDVGLGSEDDTIVFAYAQAHGDTIITIDKGLSSQLLYPPPHAGIISVRLPEQLPIAERVRMIVEGITRQSGQSFRNAILIISPGRVRLRRLST